MERAYSERSGMQVVRAIGGHAPLHLTSNGKPFWPLDDPQNVRSYAMRTGLSGNTHTASQLPQLERELAKARQTGIAYDNEELELGVRCMAAGIYDDQGKLVAAHPFLPRQTAWTTAGCPSSKLRPPHIGCRRVSRRDVSA